MKPFALIFSSRVNDDIVSTITYIKDTLKAPLAAENHYKELKKTYAKLKRNPYCMPLVRNKHLASLGIRLINVKNYILFYYIAEETKEVFLYRFMYGGRDWITILSEDLPDA